jgi:LAS superfamily LD-carboxypeptidase LdcB
MLRVIYYEWDMGLKSHALISQDIDNIVAMLNRFQDNYERYDVSFLLYADLRAMFSAAQLSLLESLLGLKDLPVLANQSDYLPPDSSEHARKLVRVHKVVLAHFKEMMSVAQTATQDTLQIVSGYRSQPYQAMILLKEIYANNFNVDEARRLVAPPGQSEHGTLPYHAVDLAIKSDGSNRSFDKTSAFGWLMLHAKDFGFSLSYPKHGSQYIYEPWHWNYTE